MQFVFLIPDKDYVRIMLKDLAGRDDVTILTTGQFAQSRRLKHKIIDALLSRFHDSPPSVLNPFWFPDVLGHINKNEEVAYVFFRTTRFSHNRSFLRWLKASNPKAHLVMIYLDVIIEAKFRQIAMEYDLTYTFDENDAEKYQIPWITGLYSALDREARPIQYDLVFIGESKDRYPLLNTIYQKLSQNETNCKFHVYEQSPKPNAAGQLQTTKEFIPYAAVLDLEQHANVVLDIVQPEQNGATLRFFEALALNKKLLTNNPGITTNKYFNPDFMKIIASGDDIDLSFIKDRIAVDYHYQGDFSPLQLLKRMETDLAVRRKQ